MKHYLATTSGPKLPNYQILKDPRVAEMQIRADRWRFCRFMMILIYVGLVMDVVTTALGVQEAGMSYEQNPLGSLLITHLGWPGLFLLLTALSAVCYVSCRAVYFRMRLGWTRLIDVLLVFMAAVRWIAVLAALGYLAQQPDLLGQRLHQAADSLGQALSFPPPGDVASIATVGVTVAAGVGLALLVYNVLLALWVSTSSSTR